ncbi:MAG TPA: transcription termination/antitermination NusG family protein, partial [Atopobiaceae bacterium]|nr:transcription termination/antitermination NusG family protein [Atopobiaceae bacterium]
MAKRWYVIHTYSGYENKVKTDLEHRIEIGLDLVLVAGIGVDNKVKT